MRHLLEAIDPTGNEFKDMVTVSATADLEATAVANRGGEVSGDGAHGPKRRIRHQAPERGPVGRTLFYWLGEQ